MCSQHNPSPKNILSAFSLHCVQSPLRRNGGGSTANIDKYVVQGSAILLFVFFTAVYFVCFVKIIDLIFRNTLSLFTSILALVC